MKYSEIRERLLIEKRSHQYQHMECTSYGRFVVMKSDNIGAIIVDPDIAEMVRNRRWSKDTHDYPVINLSSSVVRLHEVVMAQSFYELPKGCYVDHINQDKMDNRRINLRFVTPQESSRNMPLKGNNTSGVTGVYKTKYGTYRAYITANKQRKELGYYKTLEEAVAARREAEDRFNFKTRPITIKELCEVE